MTKSKRQSLIPPATADDNFQIELSLKASGILSIAGSDEVGRGPLAGPVVASSVILPPDCDYSRFIDSKKLSHKKRVELFEYLHSIPAKIGVGIVSPEVIDEINILQSSLLAMKKSIEELTSHGAQPDYVLVDGKFEIPISIAQQTLIKGESKSASIAAASIIAKVTRDSLMDKYDEQYPEYGFKKHKGYPTKFHKSAIANHGPCEIHRRTFKGVKEFVR